MAPYKIMKECYILGIVLLVLGECLLFMVEQIFLLMGRFGGHIIQIHNAQ